MKIGLLTSGLHHGHGWAHYSLSLIEALRRQGADVTVIATKNSPTDFDFQVLPLLPTIVPAEPQQLMKLALAVRPAKVVLQGCDLLHATIEPFAPLAMWAANRQPFLVTGHGSYAQAGVDRHPAVRLLHKRAFRRAGAVVCVSHYTAQRAAAYTPGIQTVVVNNGIDPARFADLPPLEEPVTRPTVLTTGGVKRRKGTLPLVRAVAQVREHIPDVQCVVVGSMDYEPDYVAQVRDAIDALDLRDHVRLLGFVPERDLLGWYGAADVFALPSINDGWKFEGYGLVHLEASAAGLPVIGTRDCGAEDAVDDGVTGRLVSQGNIDAELPAALLALLTNREQARQMGQAGRLKAQRQTWDAAAQQMRALYSRLVSPDG